MVVELAAIQHLALMLRQMVVVVATIIMPEGEVVQILETEVLADMDGNLYTPVIICYLRD